MCFYSQWQEETCWQSLEASSRKSIHINDQLTLSEYMNGWNQNTHAERWGGGRQNKRNTWQYILMQHKSSTNYCLYKNWVLYCKFIKGIMYCRTLVTDCIILLHIPFVLSTLQYKKVTPSLCFTLIKQFPNIPLSSIIPFILSINILP